MHTLKASLGVLLALLCVPSLFGQAVVNPRTGSLEVTRTDLVVPAGAINLEFTRSTTDRSARAGLLGPGWRLSWESTLRRSGDLVVIDGGAATSYFFPEAEPGQYRNESGERLVLDPSGGGVWTRKDGTRDLFDASGRLSRRDDGNGNVAALRYEAGGALSRIDAPRGAFVRFVHRADGRLAIIESSVGDRVEYTYSQGSLAAAMVNGGAPVRYSYDAAGRLAGIDDPAAGAVEYSYDEDGRVSTARWVDGSVERHEYGPDGSFYRFTDAAGGVTIVTRTPGSRREETTDPIGQRTVVDYNESGLPVLMTDASGAAASFAYDDLGRMVERIDAQLGTTRFEYLADTELLRVATYPDGTQLLLDYDGQRNLIAVRDMVGTSVDLAYFPDGLLESAEGTGVPRRSFTYDADGRLASVTDALGQVTRLEHDQRGNLVRRIDPAGGLSQYSYDAQGRLIAATDPEGSVTRYAYDDAGRLASETDPTGAVTRYEVDPRGRLSAVTDAVGRTIRLQYDGVGRLIGIVDPLGNTHHLEYDPAGRLVRAIDPLGGSATNSYDALGRIAAVTDPGGGTLSYEYSRDGLLSRVVDATGAAARLEHDRLGQVTGAFSSDGLERHFEYDAAGNLTAETDNRGLDVRHEYDVMNRLLRTIHGQGLTETFQYDLLGNLVRAQDSLGGWTSIERDRAGRITAIIGPSGAVTRLGYDAAGNLASVSDALGHATTMTYTAAGELATVTEASGDTAAYTYDRAGNLAEIRYPGGETGRFTYDAAGNITSTVGRSGAETSSTYDAARRLRSFTDAAGRTTSYSHDGDGRLTEKRLAEGTSVRYTYSAAGDLTEVSDGVFPVRFGYDAGHRRTLVEYPAIRRTLRYEYDDAGLLAAFADSEGRRVTYVYDLHRRLAAIRLPDGEAASFAYDARDRLTGIRYPNGVTGAWEYDARGLPTSITYTGPTGAVLAGGWYAYDPAGNPTEVNDPRWRVTRYSYDAAGRLVQELGPRGATHYTYLAGGNRASREGADGAVEYRYEPADRLAQAGDVSFRHDALGNLVERRGPEGITRYEYDASNRLVKVTQPDASEITFGYAPTGERIWRRTSRGLTYLVSDGVNLLAELDREFTPLRTYLHAPGIDRPLVMFEGGQPYFYHPTVLGSIVVMTDRRGEVAATYETNAFGSLREQSGSVANPFVFTARELEPELSLYYYRARYYDPSLGRFLTEDPYPPSVLRPADMNRYVYARNAPTRYTDPLGLQSGSSLARTAAGAVVSRYTDPLGLLHGEASLGRSAAETVLLSHTGSTYDAYRVYGALSSVNSLQQSAARGGHGPIAQVAATRLSAGTAARAAGHAVGLATSAAVLGPVGPGAYSVIAGGDMADVARTAVAEMVGVKPGQPAAGAPATPTLQGAATAVTPGLPPGDAALLEALARQAPAPPQAGGLGMVLDPLQQAAGGPAGGARSEAPARGGDAVLAMAAVAQARMEQFEAVLKRQMAEEAAANAQRRFSAVQAEQAAQAELRAREHALAGAALDVTGDLVQRAAAIRGEAEALKTAQDAAIQAIRSAASALQDAEGRYGAAGARLAGLDPPCEPCQELRARLEAVAAAVPQLRAEAETALNSTRSWVELTCRDPKSAEQGDGGDEAYGDARKVGELLNALNARAHPVPDLEARFTECSAKAQAYNEGIRLVRSSLDEVDGIAERAIAEAAGARGRLGAPVTECAALLRRMDSLMGGAAATAGDRARGVMGHRTLLSDRCSELETLARSAETEADAVESRGQRIRALVEVSRRSMQDECLTQPYPFDVLNASIDQATVTLTAMQVEARQNAGRVIKCLNPEPASIEPSEGGEGGEPKVPDNEGESVPALVVSSTFTTTPAEPPPPAPSEGVQPPALVRASKPGSATSPSAPASAQAPARSVVDENPVTQVYSLADDSTMQGQNRVLAEGHEGTVVASVGYRDGSRKILSGQPALTACAGLGYYVRVPGIAGWVRSGLVFARDPRAADAAAEPQPAPAPAAPAPPADGGSILEGPLNYLACINRAGDEAVWCNDACRGSGDPAYYEACTHTCDDTYEEAMKRCEALAGRE